MGPLEFGRPRVGLVLGAGAAKCWAHIGVIRCLREAGIPIDVVTGVSSGAAMAAFCAADCMYRVEEFTSRHGTVRQTLEYFDLSFDGKAILGGKGFIRWLSELLPVRRFDQLRKPLGVVVTNISDMTELHITEGALFPALRASIAVPGFMSPGEWEGKQLMDGALLNPLPIDLARSLGSDLVIAVDLFEEASSAPRAGTAAGIINRSIETMLNRIHVSNLSRNPPDVLLRPAMADFGFIQYHRTSEAIEIGYETVRARLPEIHALFNRPFLRGRGLILNSRFFKGGKRSAA